MKREKKDRKRWRRIEGRGREKMRNGKKRERREEKDMPPSPSLKPRSATGRQS